MRSLLQLQVNVQGCGIVGGVLAARELYRLKQGAVQAGAARGDWRLSLRSKIL